jgi:hypothetical protein
MDMDTTMDMNLDMDTEMDRGTNINMDTDTDIYMDTWMGMAIDEYLLIWGIGLFRYPYIGMKINVNIIFNPISESSPFIPI